MKEQFRIHNEILIEQNRQKGEMIDILRKLVDQDAKSRKRRRYSSDAE